jgi:hypothetical protein
MASSGGVRNLVFTRGGHGREHPAQSRRVLAIPVWKLSLGN